MGRSTTHETVGQRDRRAAQRDRRQEDISFAFRSVECPPLRGERRELHSTQVTSVKPADAADLVQLYPFAWKAHDDSLRTFFRRAQQHVVDAGSAVPSTGPIVARRSARHCLRGPLGPYAGAIDPLQARIAAGQWQTPTAGDTLMGVDGKERAWTTVPVKDGALKHQALTGGYALFTVMADAERVMILDAAGHS